MSLNWFSWKSMMVGLAGGLSLVVLIAAESPSAANQIGRYQLSTWSTPGVQSPGYSPEAGHHGAYRLDTQTGDVLVIDEANNVSKVEIPK